MADHIEAKDWRELCAAAVKESDPEKLMALVAEINAALDNQGNNRMGEFADHDSADDENGSSAADA